MQKMKSNSIGNISFGVLMATVLVFPAMAQSDDNSRSVRIIDGPVAAPVPAPAPAAPSPALGAPVTTLSPLQPPALPPLVAPEPAPQAPAAVVAPSIAPPPPAPVVAAPDPTPPTYNVMSLPPKTADIPRKPVDLGALSSSIKVANAAEVSVEILPGPDLAVGSRVSFRVSAKKAGYLILLDVDAAGKLTQIYPNPISLATTSAVRQNANYVRPGKPIQIPNSVDAFAGFEFVASPPFGTAMVVAFLSDRPVQKVDLPDVPTSITGQAAALTYLTKLAGDLRIVDGEAGSRLQEARWSFDAKFYAIR
jgi:hypothetical protein